MGKFFEFNGKRPVVNPTAFIHPEAIISGDVTIGKNVYIGAGTTIKGEFGETFIGDNTIILDKCTIASGPWSNVKLGENIFVNSGSAITGAILGDWVAVGANTVILEKSEIGSESNIGSLCFLPSGSKIPERKVIVGNPARTVKQVNDDLLNKAKENHGLYKEILFNSKETLKNCIPYTDAEDTVTSDETIYSFSETDDD